MDCTRHFCNCCAGTVRGAAAFLGGFTLLNLIGELASSHFDATIWWIDLRGIPDAVRVVWLGAFALLLLRFALGIRQSRRELLLSLAVVVPAVLVAARNAVTYQHLVTRDVLQSNATISVSAVVAGLLGAIAFSLVSRCLRSDAPDRQGRLQKAAVATVAVGCCVGFPLLQIHCFGNTDYRRQADAAVVFGCRVYADGRLSAALEDRVRSGVELYREGLVQYLIMTGGPGDGPIHETEAMRQYAIAAGVPAERIFTDQSGWNTDLSVTGTMPLCRKHRLKRLLAVSHDFHLPRIKLAYARAGRNVLTVPARQKYRLPQRPFLLARETAALWAYYLQPLTRL